MQYQLLETALRNKYRFPYKGQISVEDLYTLPVEELDKVYKDLMSLKRKSEGDSLLSDNKPEIQEVENRIEIVKHIVSLKLEEAEERKKAAEKKEKRQQILEIMADKQNEELKNMSKEELAKLLEDL